ncbi:hypothetical protein [Roseateles sp. P5_E11]
MGTEYRLTFSHLDKARIEHALSEVATVKIGSVPTPSYEFRADSTKPGMPDATAMIEQYGLYFCDHGGSGRDYLGRLVAVLVGEFGSVRVEALE